MSEARGSESKMTSETESEWPRAFRMFPSTGPARPKFWTHELYRGPREQPVRILYSRTKMQSEEIAHEFLGQNIVGFDMEWPWQKKGDPDVPLQQRIGLIQIASEDTIGLFHIGLHSGQTPKDVLAPTLRTIIESNDITKTGVGILNADFSRLRRWFDVKPQGAFELSHLHNLVTYGAKYPKQVTTKMKALSAQVQEHLGLPLNKGKVRTSNWSRPLSPAQIQYAAADAYAGLMLFYVMNAKRLAMSPVPPIPLHAETYQPMRPGMGGIIPVRLGPSSNAAGGVSACEFYGQSATEDEARSAHENMEHVEEASEEEEDKIDDQDGTQKRNNDVQPCGGKAVISTSGQDASGFESEVLARIQQGICNEAIQVGAAIYEKGPAPRKEKMGLVAVGRIGRQLLLEQRPVGTPSDLPKPPRPAAASQAAPHPPSAPAPKLALKNKPSSKPTTENAKALFARLSAHRKRVAQERRCSAFVVAYNTTLTGISEQCPRNEQELRKINGIGPKKVELYGAAWLAIVREFLKEQAVVAPRDEEQPTPSAPMPATPICRRTQRSGATQEASASRGRTTPAVLHTGLSFRMENATLEAEVDHSVVVVSDDSEDEDSVFGSPMRSPSPSTLKRKREGVDSSTRNRTKQRPVLPQPALQSPRPATNAVQQVKPTQAPTVERAISAEKAPSLHTKIKRPSPARPQHAAHAQHTAPKQLFAQPPAVGGPKAQASTETQIFRNKLLAFNKRVTAVMVLSEATIEQIIQKPPRTAQELLQIPDIIPFANECARKNQCLLTFILKSTPNITATAGP